MCVPHTPSSFCPPQASSQYSTHMAKPSVAASEFSKTKSLKQQREYLPIHGCREELMQACPPKHTKQNNNKLSSRFRFVPIL